MNHDRAAAPAVDATTAVATNIDNHNIDNHIDNYIDNYIDPARRS